MYFRTYCTLLLLSEHRISSVICPFLQLSGYWSYEEETNCEYALLRRQNMVCFSSPCLLQPALLLINFQLFFFTPTSNPHSCPFCTWEYFNVEILSPNNKHQWLNKLCYHYDVLLEKDWQRKLKLGNSTKIYEYKSSRKIRQVDNSQN